MAGFTDLTVEKIDGVDLKSNTTYSVNTQYIDKVFQDGDSNTHVRIKGRHYFEDFQVTEPLSKIESDVNGLDNDLTGLIDMTVNYITGIPGLSSYTDRINTSNIVYMKDDPGSDATTIAYMRFRENLADQEYGLNESRSTIKGRQVNAGTNSSFSTNKETIANDAAFSFTPAVSEGTIIIEDGVAVEGAHILFKVSSTNATAIVAATANVNVSTVALSGTTGIDAKLTVSANDSDGKIYIENRLGKPRDITYTILGQ